MPPHRAAAYEKAAAVADDTDKRVWARNSANLAANIETGVESVGEADGGC